MSDTRPIVLFGSPGHAGLQILYQNLVARGLPTLFLIQEGFAGRTRMYLDQDPNRSTLILPEEEALDLKEIRSFCLDGFYVPAGYHLDGLSESDVGYVQTETWSMLIYLFQQIHQVSLLVNFIENRDVFSNRWGTLRYLAQCGLPVPRNLITSDPDSLRAFRESVGQIMVKSVGDHSVDFSVVDAAYDDRLENLLLAPAQFEEVPTGQGYFCGFVDGQSVVIPTADSDLTGQEPPPAELLEKCWQAALKLKLHVAETTVRKTSDGRWLVTGMRPFLSLGMLSNPRAMDLMVKLLERGRRN